MTQRAAALTPTLMKIATFSPAHNESEMRTRRPVGVWMRMLFHGDIYKYCKILLLLRNRSDVVSPIVLNLLQRSEGALVSMTLK